MANTIAIEYVADSDEYIVPHPSGEDDCKYFTDDKEDALETARIEWKDHDVTFVIRCVKKLTI